MRVMLKTMTSLAFSLTVGCGVNLAVDFQPQGDPSQLSVTDSATATDYTVTLSRCVLVMTGEFGPDEDNLAELNGVISSELLLGSLSFAGIGELPEDKVAPLFVRLTPTNDEALGEIPGSALGLDGVVTLSDNTVVNFSARVPASGESIDLSLPLEYNFFSAATAAGSIDLGILLQDIDFDALGAGGVDVTIIADSGDPAIDAALSTLQANLAEAFTASAGL